MYMTPITTIRTSRFSRADRRENRGPFTTEAEALGLSWRSEALGMRSTNDNGLPPLPPHIAEVLGEDTAIVKHRRMWLDDIPFSLADSYVPASVDEEIGWSAGREAPGGLYGLLETSGHLITRFREELTGRYADPHEVDLLGLDVGAWPPVAVLTRHAITDTGRVVEYFESVTPLTRYRYVYEFPAPD